MTVDTNRLVELQKFLSKRIKCAGLRKDRKRYDRWIHMYRIVNGQIDRNIINELKKIY